MQLILLSGGSGKRLWPLSNNARSKQFLPLLEKEDGSMESMVQRVVRQATEAHLTDNVTLATNASQLDIITNQLGDKVSVVTEPERRDTFPAIALAASYLSLEKRCSDDEVVVIMPCDPYTEAGYFETIARMAGEVENGSAELVLMGITPTYPSAKYGYIVPQSGNCGTSSAKYGPGENCGTSSVKYGPGGNCGTSSAKYGPGGNCGTSSAKYDQSGSCGTSSAKFGPGGNCGASSAKFGPGENCGTSSASPRVCGTSLRVERFTEKPTVAVAEELLRQGALWNGGVFAFRLGHMMDIVRKYVAAETFEETRKRYSEFPKISFDYEVAEKARSVAVVPYTGEWKDLGTWNTLTDELSRKVIGNAHLGPKCVNTHVINELQYPVFVDGLQDTVVAACPDGILVCAKKETENIKKYVDALEHRPMYEERRWGSYRVIDESEYSDGFKSLSKSLTLKAGKSISYQIHHHRSEVWTFVDGNGLFAFDGQVRKVGRGDTVVIPAGHLHSVKALTDLTFIEVQTGCPLIEEDIERFPWTWE